MRCWCCDREIALARKVKLRPWRQFGRKRCTDESQVLSAVMTATLQASACRFTSGVKGHTGDVLLVELFSRDRCSVSSNKKEGESLLVIYNRCIYSVYLVSRVPVQHLSTPSPDA